VVDELQDYVYISSTAKGGRGRKQILRLEENFELVIGINLREQRSNVYIKSLWAYMDLLFTDRSHQH
jgi:hypothetical protein